MNLDIRYAHHPDDVKGYDTTKLREHFLVEQLFVPGEIALTYTHVDRVVFGGATPTDKPLALLGGKDFGTDVFLERRELGIINIGGEGSVTLDGVVHPMIKGDGFYVGKGTKQVLFASKDAKNPAQFYLASSPAHQTFPTVKIEFAKANPRKVGAPETVNVRTIYQYVHPAVCQSCQLVMGMTLLETGSVWNTMPCHTHERRMEVYLYFDMAADTRVFHMHGQPSETRHLVVADRQAVISPSWSIHSGVGTGSYTFIWAMAGENQTFDDMDHVKPEDLR
ncbi:MAG: 5-dehydro-4-deoxy-D-glucuronate isomerase [Spirochaetales bacterium]